MHGGGQLEVSFGVGGLGMGGDLLRAWRLAADLMHVEVRAVDVVCSPVS